MSILNVQDPLQVPLFPSNPIPNGQVSIFARNTDTYVPLFDDPDLTITRANPVDGDANGNFPPIYLVNGIYKMVVRDQSGKLIATQQRVVVNLVSRNSSGQRDFLTLDDLLANASLSYTTSDPYALVIVGELLRVSDTTYAYEVAEEDATDYHVSTDGGVRLYERHIFSSRSRFVDAVARGWTMPLGHTQTVDGLQYTYIGPGYSDGPADLPGWMPVTPVTPGHFANDLSTDATDAFNAAIQFAAAFNVQGRSSGTYNVTGTIAPGAPFTWDWGSTVLNWTGSDVTVLTEVMFNPNGTTESQPSGKYVLFDTKGCTGSTSTGLLQIRGGSPGRMALANRASIPRNLVAITASSGFSADMIWEGLSILGCHHGLWSGDQRGSGSANLPYTRWTVSFLKIQFCLVAINGGAAGNAFDDGIWKNIRLTRNEANGTIRTDFICGSLFLNGLSFNNDSEPQTAATVAGSNIVTLSAPSPFLSVGNVICIQGANDNLAGSNPIPLVSRVTAVNGAVVTLESPADRNTSGAAFIINPPSFVLNNASLIAQHVYVEESHDTPVQLQNQAVLDAQSLKVSDGHIGARYNTPILITGLTDTAVAANLHDRSINSDEVKGVVGVSNLVDAGGAGGSALVELIVRTAQGTWDKSQPVRVVALESDHLFGASQNAAPRVGNGYNVSVRYTDGTAHYQVGDVGTQEAYATGPFGGFELGPNLRGSADMTGVSNTGQCGAPSGGAAVKSPGGPGHWFAPAVLTPGTRMRVDVTAEAFVAGICALTLYDSAGAGPGTTVASFEQLAGTGRNVIFFDVPPGSTADRIGFFCSGLADLTLSRFTVQQVLSV